ncbi:MAG: SAM-dependent DNA methyltransferase, partial [Polyangia bacterium]
LKKRNKAELGGQTDMFVDGTTLRPPKVISQEATQVESLPDDSIQGIHAKEQAYQGFEHSAAFSHAKLLADTWCAAFVWKKTAPDAITTDTIFKLAADPNTLPTAMRAEVERLTTQYKFFHWHLGFPQVFRLPSNGDRPNEQGWIGGFDVVLGNPPWERVKLQEKEWFASRRPDIADATNASHRKHMIEKLAVDDPTMSAAFLDARRQAEAESSFALTSGRFPLCGRGDVNTYTVFVEWNRSVLSANGRVGCIVPTGVATDNTTRELFQALVEGRSLVSLFDFQSGGDLFGAIGHARFKFCLLTLSPPGQAAARAEFAFFARRTEDLQDRERRFTLSAEEISLLNPNTRTCPTFCRHKDVEISTGVYRRLPVLVREGSPEVNPWAIQFASMFHMTNDSGLFKDRAELAADGWRLADNVFVKGKTRYLPLYEAKMVHLFDHRWGDYADHPPDSDNTSLPDVPTECLARPDYVVQPWFWVPEAEVGAAVGEKWRRGWFLGLRDICRSTDERTVIAGFIPRVGVGNQFPLALSAHEPRLVAGLGANLTSLVFDYIARQKVGGTHLNFFIVNQLPVIPPATFQSLIPWLIADAPAVPWFAARVLELTYTAHDMTPFARDLGYDGPPFRWDDTRRTQIRAELDAAFLHLYGLDRSDAEWVLDSFPVLKKNEESKLGEFRTKRLVLAMYDAMAEAQRTATAFASPLTPPPADPRAAHPATTIAPAVTSRPGT